MNVKELIEKYEHLNHDCFRRVDTSKVLRDLKQLDEPEKPVVPKFAADVIEGAREQSPELEDALHYTWGKGTKEFTEWYKKKSNRDLFARAWLDGYEVEEEKRYYIRLKFVDGNYNYLNYIKHLSAWCLTEIKTDKKFRTTHTRKELEDAGFGEVFNSTLFEVEEVE